MIRLLDLECCFDTLNQNPISVGLHSVIMSSEVEYRFIMLESKLVLSVDSDIDNMLVCGGFEYSVKDEVIEWTHHTL